MLSYVHSFLTTLLLKANLISQQSTHAAPWHFPRVTIHQN